MHKLLSCILLLIIFNSVNAQFPILKWEKNFGGSQIDECSSIAQYSDSVSIICGTTSSGDYDVNQTIGVPDIFIAKVTNSGTRIWRKTYGGSDSEEAYSIIRTSDNKFVIAGETSSNDHDVSGFHYNVIPMYSDGWLFKIDSVGTILWQLCLGGSETDYLEKVSETSDSGFIAIGQTYSFDFDVSNYHGSGDIFVVKVDKNGILQWSKAFGGIDGDYGKVARETTRGTFLIGGNTLSNDGDISGHHSTSSADIWIAELDSLGNLLSQRCYGGLSVDNISNIIIAGSYYYIMGETASNNGDITNNNGGYNIWLAKLDSTGNIIWQNNYGGIFAEGCYNGHQTSDSGFVVCGIAFDDDGIITGTHGFEDYLILKVDSNGNYQWSKCLGGIWDDRAKDVLETVDGDYIVVGESQSDDGDVGNNYGLEDWWVVRISTDTTTNIPNNHTEKSVLIESLEQSENGIKFISKVQTNALIQIYNITGQLVYESTREIMTGENQLTYPGSMANGKYILKIKTEKFNYSRYFMKSESRN